MQSLSARRSARNIPPFPFHNLPPRVREVLREEAERHTVSVVDLLGPCAARSVSHARWVVWYRLRALTMPGGQPISYPQIAAWFRRDHTTIIYGVRRLSEAAKAA